MRATFVVLCAAVLVVALAGAGAALAAPPDPADGGDGTEWRQLYETTGASWSEVAQVCPRDGATPCSGSIGTADLTGWVWATSAQVLAFMGKFEPALLTGTPGSSAEEWFGSASEFLSEVRWTGYFVLYGGYAEWATGWTSSTDASGFPLAGSVAYGWWPPFGSFGIFPSADIGRSDKGVFLWRSTAAPSPPPPPPPPPAEPEPEPDPTPPPPPADTTPPVITASVSGTAGSNGWYVSDVSVSWTVADAESTVGATTGCDATTVTSDSTGTTFTCEATSDGGTATASAVVKRDATAPTVTCQAPAPVFQMYEAGASVTATVADDTSGAAGASVTAPAATAAPGTFAAAVSGADAAGNRSTQQCGYEVAVPTCNGLAATRIGTGENDTITGTNGRDVIVGLAGADTIAGLDGNDVICGGDGADTIDGGDGDDFLDGGNDADSLRGGKGKDSCTSGEVRMSSCDA